MTVPELPAAEATVARLRGPLLAELHERPRRRRPLRLALGAAAAAGVAAALAFAPGSSPALAVERHGDVIELRIVDAAAGADELTQALHDAGIRGEVRVIAVPPELVGTWAAISESAPVKTDGEHPVRLDRIEYGSATVRVSASAVRDSDGTFTFFAGRAAREGEAYDFDGERFRPGLFGP